MLVKNLLIASNKTSEIKSGEAVFTNIGTNSWVVPTGVTSISAVCIGGGGGGDASDSGGSGGAGGDLRWHNNLPVTPGETLTILVGDSGTGQAIPTDGDPSRISRGGLILLEAAGGGSGSLSGSTAPNGTSSTIGGLIGGGNGGTSGNPSSITTSGGGGAGGYEGNGGNGSVGAVNGGDGVGGSGGGGGGGGDLDFGGPGGGVNVFGGGPNGVGGSGSTANGQSATGGSYGDGAVNHQTSASVGRLFLNNFGGGGGGSDNTTEASSGGQGAVRILWPGDNRLFPNGDVWMSEIIRNVIEIQNSANTIRIPASAQVGDLAVLMNMSVTIGTQSNPLGWTRIVNQEVASPVMTVWYRIIQSGDPDSPVTMTSGTSPSSEMILFRSQAGPISSVTVIGATYQQASTIVPSQYQILSARTPVFIAFGVFCSSSAQINTNDMYFTGGIAGNGNIEPSVTFNENGDTSRQGFMRFRIYDKAPQNDLTVVNRRDTGNQTMASFIIEVN